MLLDLYFFNFLQPVQYTEQALMASRVSQKNMKIKICHLHRIFECILETTK